MFVSERRFVETEAFYTVRVPASGLLLGLTTRREAETRAIKSTLMVHRITTCSRNGNHLLFHKHEYGTAESSNLYFYRTMRSFCIEIYLFRGFQSDRRRFFYPNSSQATSLLGHSRQSASASQIATHFLI